jgi:hypothetical protein
MARSISIRTSRFRRVTGIHPEQSAINGGFQAAIPDLHE